jgi:hypothetical protein
MRYILTLIFALIGLQLPTFAQINTANLSGRVLDSSGATVANAELSLLQSKTGFARNTTSDERGSYLFPLLPPGEYEVTAEHAGFKLEKRHGIVLAAGDHGRLELSLSPGSITESVVVVSDAPQTNTESSALGFVAGTRAVQSLPLASRNFDQLIMLGAGIVRSRPGTVPSFSVNGTSQYGYSLSLDGTDASAIEAPTTGDPTAGSGARLNVVSPDSIEQLELQTATFAADSGRAAGAVINIISKSGTNQLHGTLYEYFRNDKLDARNFFSATKDPLRQNQFGGSVSGPIVKDRLFLFGNYEGSRARIGRQITSNVPTAALRDKAPSVFQTYLAAVPLPIEAIANNADVGFYRRSDRFKADEQLFNLRADYVDGPNSLFARYSLNKSETSVPNFIPANRLLYPLTNHLATISHTRLLGTASFNELRLGFDRWDVPRENSTYAAGLGSITVTGALSSNNAEGILHYVDST